MNYKSILEEQVRELQKVQDKAINGALGHRNCSVTFSQYINASCQIATKIIELTHEADRYVK